MFMFATAGSWGFLPYASFAVFKNLLGDTILINDLDSATNYRLAVSDACCWSFATLTFQFLFSF